MYMWSEFERTLTAFMKLTLLHNWNYPVRKESNVNTSLRPNSQVQDNRTAN